MAIKNQQGTTLIELLVAMAIIGIMSAIFVSQINLTDGEELNMVTERVAADLKQIRNLSTSRVINEDNIYPLGGYGMYFDNSGEYAYYILFANDIKNGYDPEYDVIVSKYIFPNKEIRVYPKSEESTQQFVFAFINEHEAYTDIERKPGGLEYSISLDLNGARNTIAVSDPSEDDYVWGNVNILYGE